MGASRSRTDDAAATVEAAAVVTATVHKDAYVRARPAANSSYADEAHVGRAGSAFGRYLVIEEIGRGGMGEVTRAYDARLQREVALKRIRRSALGGPGDETAEPDARAPMLREAQAMAKLSHPNVVAVFDVDLVAGDMVIAMEYVRGTTLKRWLEQDRPWGERVAALLAAGRGLAAAHAASLLHRDFKPDNVLVGDDGRVRVTDFGLARIEDTATSEHGIDAERGELSVFGTVVGTPRYMAPEQLEGCAVIGALCDQYAFCLTAWEALTRRRAFEAADLETLAARKREGPPPWPREVLVPAVIREAIIRGLAPDPCDRWPDMEALLEVLARGAAPRHRGWGIAAGALATLLCSGVAAGAHQQRLAERCTGATTQLADAWSAQRRDAVQQALGATGTIYAADVWRRLAPVLDAYAASWVTAHTRACEATTVRGEQPMEVLDLTMACLHRAKVDLRAATQLLASADAQVVEKAHQIVGSLPDLERCADIDALRSEVRPPAPADKDAVEAIHAELAEVRALREAGKYPEVMARMDGIIGRSAVIPHAPLQADVLLELGSAQIHVGRFSESEAALKRALRVALECKQWNHAVSAASKLVYVAGPLQTRTPEALAFAETARGMLPLAGIAAEAELSSHIGAALDAQGWHAQAEPHHRAAVATGTRVWGARHLHVATYRGKLGESLELQGRFHEAEPELEAKLQIREELLGPDHPEVANARFFLGNTIYHQGRFAEAELQYRLALSSWEKVLGPDAADTSMARAHVGNVLAAQGREAEAAVELQAALLAQRKVFGPDHVNTVMTQGSLGAVLVLLGRHGEAEEHLRASVAASERAYGPYHSYVSDIRSNLATLFIRQGRYEEAEAETRTAMVALKKSAGEEHPSMLRSHSNLGAALTGQGRYREGEAQYRIAVGLARKLWGAQHPYAVRMLNGLSSNLERQGRLEEAEAEARTALADQLAATGPEHGDVATTRGGLGSILRAGGRYREAEAEYRTALRLLEAARGQHNPEIAKLQAGLGATLLARGHFLDAVRLLEPAWEAWHEDARVDAATRARLGFTLARASLSGRPAERHRARSLAEQAAALLRAMPSARDSELVAIETWLCKHAGNTAP